MEIDNLVVHKETLGCNLLAVINAIKALGNISITYLSAILFPYKKLIRTDEVKFSAEFNCMQNIWIMAYKQSED